MHLLYLFSKRENAAKGHLEMLEAERNSHNCDAEDKPEHKVQGGYLPPSKKDPYKVHHSGEAPGFIGPVN